MLLLLQINFTFLFAAPGVPEIIETQAISSHSCVVSWKEQDKSSFLVEYYSVSIVFSTFSYVVPENCPETVKKEKKVKVDNANDFTFDNLLPAAEYEIQVQAVNSENSSTKASTTCRTQKSCVIHHEKSHS